MDYSKALIDFDFAAAELKMLAHTFGAVGGSIRAVNETLRKAMYELMHPHPHPRRAERPPPTGEGRTS